MADTMHVAPFPPPVNLPERPSPVLVVEDSRSDAVLLREQLVDQGWERESICIVATLQAARQAVASVDYAAVLLDLTLPDASGLEAVSVLSAAAPASPIVVVTAWPEDSLVLAALAAGAEGSLTKPFLEGTTLADAVMQAVARHRAESQVETAVARAFDSIAMPAAVLDGSGRILGVNAAWVETARQAGAATEAVGVHVNYLTACDVAVGAFSEGAAEAAAGIRAVLAGRSASFSLDYPCPAGELERWFTMRVAPLGIVGGGAVVTHVDVTALKRAERRMQGEGSRLAGRYDESFPIFALLDGTGMIRHISSSTQQLLGLELGDVVGTNALVRLDPRDAQAAADAFTAALVSPGTSQALRVRAQDGNGRWHDLDVAAVNLLEDDRVRAIVVTGTDVTAGRLAQIAGRLESRLLQRLPASVIVTDEQGVVVYWNDRAEALFGYTAAEAVGRPAVSLNMGPERQEEAETIMAAVLAGGRWEGTYDSRRADGSVIPLQLTLEAVADAEIGFRGIVGAALDITERRQLEADLAFRALHDPLTGLPNRRLFVDHLESALARSDRHGTLSAVLFIDLDQFKAVNDLGGHGAGDAVLRTVAAYLEGLVRPGDLVARLGGDEFVVCCENLDSPGEAPQIARRLLRALEAPFRVDGKEFLVTASVGVALSSPGCHPEALIRRSDAAMYAAKEAGRARVEMFDDELHALVRQRHQTARDLARALDDGELEVFYQPEVQIATGRLSGFEALARWRHPERGLVLPDEFIGAAEESGLIGRLGQEVLEQACGALAGWLALAPGRPITVAVNVSVVQLADPDFPGVVEAAIAAAGVPPASVCLEVTESALLEPALADRSLQKLKAVGVRIAIDDFGTGYSSLSRLKRFPVDFLKIDRSFVDGIGRDPEDEVIVNAVVNLAHSLNLAVVAEGIETDDQLQWLGIRGCEIGQGYLWSAAVDAETASLLVTDNADGWVRAASAKPAVDAWADEAGAVLGSHLHRVTATPG